MHNQGNFKHLYILLLDTYNYIFSELIITNSNVGWSFLQLAAN
jgi:hypothetical protein